MAPLAGVILLVVVLTGCSGGAGQPADGVPPSSSAPPPPSAPPSPNPDPTSEEPVEPDRPTIDPSATEPPLSATDPPVPSRPPVPPTEPSDRIGSMWVTGTVTRGGDGPCYGLVGDEGAEYALYSGAGRTLEKGARVAVLVSPAAFSVDCGPGVPMRLKDVRPA